MKFTTKQGLTVKTEPDRSVTISKVPEKKTMEDLYHEELANLDNTKAFFDEVDELRETGQKQAGLIDDIFKKWAIIYGVPNPTN